MNQYEQRLQELVNEAKKAGYVFTITVIEKTRVQDGKTQKELDFTLVFNESTHGKKNPTEESVDK